MIKSERKLGVVLTYVNIFLNTLVMLIYTPFIIKYLGQSEYGLYALAMSILTYLALLDFGFGNAIVVLSSRYIVKKERNKQKLLYSTIFTSYIFISLISIICIFLFYHFSGDIFSKSMSVSELDTFKLLILIIGFNIAISIPANIFRSILTAYEKFIFINGLSIFRALSIPFITVLVIYLEFRAVAMIAVVTFVNVVFLFIQYCYYKKHINISMKLGFFDLDMFKIAFGYSIFIFIATVVDQVNWNFGQLLIGAYLGVREVAIYSIALLFNTTFIMLSTALSNVLLPKVSKMISEGIDDDNLTSEMIKVGRLQSYIVLSVLFGFSLFGKIFIEFWAGKEYEDAYYLTLIVMIPLTIPLIQNLGLSILKAKNKFAFRAYASLIMSFITIGMSILFTERYGYWGVAISLSITFFLLNGFVMNIYYQYVGINVLRFWKNIASIFFTMLMLYFLAYLYINIIQVNTIFMLCLNVAIYMLVIFIASYLFTMNLYERDKVKEAIQKLKVFN